MRTDAFIASARRAWRSRTLLALSVLVAGLVVTVALSAQSFLGSLRGTVTDPQGAAVPKSAVLVTDEATGVPRALETDDQGRYEAADLQPGTYRVEVVTNNFKKF